MTGSLSRILGAALASVFVALPALAQDSPGHPVPGQIHLQPSVTPIMDSITVFHDGILLWSAILITLLVLVLLVIVMVRFNAKANPTPSSTTHNTLIEVVWTVAPILVLVIIAIPSFSVLTDQLTIPDGQRKYLGSNIFSFGEVDVPAPTVTIKATGIQWSWDYEYPDEGVTFSSVILPETSTDGFDRPTLKPDQPRLLAVSNEIVVPVNATVRVQVTSEATGVIHAFAVPSFGIKVDAVPGKLNETWFNARKTGIYYGQCSELCGKDHAFMPIAVRVVEPDQYAAWLAAAKAGAVEQAYSVLPPL